VNATRAAFAADVRAGLSLPRKQLPARWLYDEVGSALFEAICALPEYGLTRADERILIRHADEILASAGEVWRVAELGSGTGRKTRVILEAAARLGPVSYLPIDVSRAALERCEREMSGLAAVSVRALEMDYLDGLRAIEREGHGRLLVLFLGSSIGNFDQAAALAFLRDVRAVLAPGDLLLLGADLVKAPELLLEAYDDPIGLTAAFNRNVLARINRELEGSFDVRAFAHEARYDPAAQRVEMHLRATSRQEAAIRAAGLRVTVEAGETIWTESSYKFRMADLERLAQDSGFSAIARWCDDEWPFTEMLLRVRP
jgi:dimethylhistidine N-methyltransferase